MRRTVLVVDDNEGLRRALVRLIEAHGFATLEADSGSAAADVLNVVPGFVLLDLMLPVMPGEEILRMIRSKGLKTRVIVMTATGDEERIRALDALKPDAVLRKPFEIDQLIGVLKRYS